jgi:hypothetical protein
MKEMLVILLVIGAAVLLSVALPQLCGTMQQDEWARQIAEIDRQQAQSLRGIKYE